MLNRSQLKKFWWVLTITATFVGVVSSAKVFGDKGYADGYKAGRDLGKLECKPNSIDRYFVKDNVCDIALDDGSIAKGYCIETETPCYPRGFIGPLPKDAEICRPEALPVPTPINDKTN